MAEMIEVINLSTGEQQFFTDNVKPENAVNFCWHVEHNRMSEYWEKIYSGHDFSEDVTRGKSTLSRGDWCTMRTDVGKAATSPTDETL